MSDTATNPQAGGAAVPTAGGETLLQVRGLVKHFPVRAGLIRHVVDEVHAVCGASFDLGAEDPSGSARGFRARHTAFEQGDVDVLRR